MILSLAFLLAAGLLGFGLLKAKEKENADWRVFFFAILAGLWSLLAFSAPAANAVYQYNQQGKADLLTSETGGKDRPVVPPMTDEEFGAELSLSFFGIAGAALFLAVACISGARKKLFRKWTFAAAGCNLAAWALHIVAFGYFEPLPTAGQNIMFALVWLLPALICILFDMLWISRAAKA